MAHEKLKEHCREEEEYVQRSWGKKEFGVLGNWKMVMKAGLPSDTQSLGYVVNE